jgi:hypothetical protein
VLQTREERNEDADWAYGENACFNPIHQIPPEVALNIAGWLSPTDLVSFGQTSHRFRQVLLANGRNGKPSQNFVNGDQQLPFHIHSRHDIDIKQKNEYDAKCDLAEDGSPLSSFGCSGCRKIHPTSFFTDAQLAQPAKSRLCKGLEFEFPLCSGHTMSGKHLMQALRKLPTLEVWARGEDDPLRPRVGDMALMYQIDHTVFRGARGVTINMSLPLLPPPDTPATVAPPAPEPTATDDAAPPPADFEPAYNADFAAMDGDLAATAANESWLEGDISWLPDHLFDLDDLPDSLTITDPFHPDTFDPDSLPLTDYPDILDPELPDPVLPAPAKEPAWMTAGLDWLETPICPHLTLGDAALLPTEAHGAPPTAATNLPAMFDAAPAIPWDAEYCDLTQLWADVRSIDAVLVDRSRTCAAQGCETYYGLYRIWGEDVLIVSRDVVGVDTSHPTWAGTNVATSGDGGLAGGAWIERVNDMELKRCEGPCCMLFEPTIPALNHRDESRL